MQMMGYASMKGSNSNSTTSLVDLSSPNKRNFFSRIFDKLNLTEKDFNLSMQSYDEFEPHASYNALMK